MPSLGAGMESGVVTRWLKRPGDRVERGDIVAEIETEKGIIEIEIFASGVIERLVVEEGVKVPVGTLLAIVGAPGTADAAQAAVRAAEAKAGTAPSPAPIAPAPVAAAPAAPIATTPGARRLARESDVPLAKVTPTGRHKTITRGDVARTLEERSAHATTVAELPPARPKVSPLARARARELAVDLAHLTPTAPGGAIHAADVERAARDKKPAPADKQAAMRRAIALAMSKSKREIPHYYVSTTIDLTPALDWLARQNEARPVTERLLPGVLLLEAAVRALRDVPELNAHWTGQSAPPLPRVHLGVAIALRGGGLIAPAIHDADGKSLDGLMTAFKDLVARARTGALKGSELSDPTITVTSLGERGVDAVFPIVHPPQVAMVGFGKIAQRPWVAGGELRVRSVVTASLAADHRVSDGHRGGLYLAAIDKYLSERGSP